VHLYHKKKGLSQEELSFLADLHRTCIGQIEAGNRNVALKNIIRIAKALKISPKDLFDK
jgi:DNA-binding XRE family transcriptional regulator